MPLGGLAAVPLGIAIGLPALRLRGINLAIVTLGFASAFDVILAAITFPGQTEFLPVPRPSAFDFRRGLFLSVPHRLRHHRCSRCRSSRAPARCVLARHPSFRARGGRPRRQHPGRQARAFAISAFVAGVSGGLLAGYLGTLVADNFTLMQSLASVRGRDHGRARNIAEGAIIGGLLVTLFPEILRRLGLPQDLGNVLFAVGAVQSLTSGESMSESLRARSAPLAATRTARSAAPQASPTRSPAARRRAGAERSRRLRCATAM